MLSQPLRLEFGRGEVPQRRMDPLVRIDIIQEAANLVISIMVVEIVRQVNLLFLDRSYETLGITVLPSYALLGQPHTMLDLKGLDQ